MAQWLRCCIKDLKVTGSNPISTKINAGTRVLLFFCRLHSCFFFIINPSLLNVHDMSFNCTYEPVSTWAGRIECQEAFTRLAL